MVQPVLLGYGQSLLEEERPGRLSLLLDQIPPLLTFGDVTLSAVLSTLPVHTLIAAVLDKVFVHHLSNLAISLL